MTAKKTAPSKLTGLGDSAETLLAKIIKDMDKDMKVDAEKRKYTLTDQMKVLDRIAKFESIRAKITDEEGQFFNAADEEGENDDGNAD